MRRLLPTVLILLASLAPAAPAVARANRTDHAIVRDYARDGRISGRWTIAQLRHALRNLSRDQRQYSDVDRAIRRAIRARQRNRGA